MNRSTMGLARRFAVVLPALAVLGLFSLASPQARSAIIDLGQAGAYAVFGLGSTMDVGTSADPFGDSFKIYGDVAVGADTTSATADGYGNFQKGFIQGNLFVDNSTALSPGFATWKINNDAGVSGTIDGVASPCTNTAGCGVDYTGNGGTDLSQAVHDAVTWSAFYDALPGTSLGNYNPGSGATSLAAGVYDATGFSFSSTILTIIGGPGDSFVLNDSGGFSFNQSTIVLQGGITSDNVLFNVTGTGSGVTVSNGHSTFQGTLLAVSRDITLTDIGQGTAPGIGAGADGVWGTTDDNFGFDGRVIGSLTCPNLCTTPGITQTAQGLQLIVHSGAEINYFSTLNQPPPQTVPEPSTLATALLGLALLGLARVRRTHRRIQGRAPR
jgi:PEP-CTERM motif